MSVLIVLHALAAVVWVGGMFFAYLVLRPAAGPLEAPVRFALWRRALGRFFPWVWASVAVLLASGYAMLFLHFGGFAGAGVHIHLMQVTGIVMMLLFMHMYFAPWPRFESGYCSSSCLAIADISASAVSTATPSFRRATPVRPWQLRRRSHSLDA